MGFQLRKSMEVGPLRLNFSKSEKKDKSALVGKLVAVGIVLLVILSLGLLSGCGGDSTAASSISGEPVQSRKSPLESVTAAASQLEKPAEGEKPAVEPAPTPEPEKPAAEPASAQEPEEGPVVIGNKNSKKYHELGCSSIEDMKESNRIELESAAVAEAGGYKPCARCHSGK